MTGPEHYQAGERELAAAAESYPGFEAAASYHLRRAHAHFAAAQAAATAAGGRGGMLHGDSDAWQKVTQP